MSRTLRRLIKYGFLLLFPAVAMAQTDAFNGFCNRGAWPVTLSGMNSTNRFQNVIPHCTITVYLTGTTTLATIYKDAISTPQTNPFTGDALTSLTPGKWLFFAADGQGYDVIGSGGDSPNVYPTPVTIATDLKVGSGGGGGCVTAGIAGQFQVSNGTGGCTATNIMVNGINLIAPSPLNFIDSATVKWTNPSLGNVSATATVIPPNAVTFRHNGTNLTGQFAVNPQIFDMDDNNPAPPTGFENVAFQTDASTGKWSANVPVPSVGLGTVINAPIVGQYAVVYPTSGTITSDPSARSSIFPNGTVSAPTAGSGYFWWGCNGLLCNIAPSFDAHYTFTLPSYINPANVTAVYADSWNSLNDVNSLNGGLPTSGANSSNLDCVRSGGAAVNLMVSRNSVYAPTEVTLLTDATGGTFNTMVCSAHLGVGQGAMNLTVAAIRMLVYYTGTPPPVDNTIKLLPPLQYNLALNEMFVDETMFPAGVISTTTFTSLPAASTYPFSVIAVLGTANCTSFISTTNSFCISNGSVWIPFVPNGSGGTYFTETLTCSGTSCTLTHSPAEFDNLSVNGLVMVNGTDFTQSGTAITLTTPAVGGDVYYAQYHY